MTKLKVVTFASIAAILFCPAVFSAGPNSIPGEKLDSGLGDLPSGYTAAEFQRAETQPNVLGYHVLGEKLDSGLGDLPPSYTAAEFQRAQFQLKLTGYHVLGEKLDSGLGELTLDQRPDIVATRKTSY
jgi:hypothetical protein